MSGLKKFILRGSLVDLAVAVVVGTAFAALISELVQDLGTPLIAAAIGQPDFSKLTFTINNSTFRYGDFINALITFLIVAAVVYFFAVVPLQKLRDRYAPEDPEAPKRDCPECLSSIPAEARRCAFCTAEIAGLGEQTPTR